MALEAAVESKTWRFHRRRPTVLVAHADAFTRAELAAALEQDGYKLVEADSGDDVLHALAAMALHRGPRLDLLIVDHTLLGWSARELLDELQAGELDLPTVLIVDDERAARSTLARHCHAVFRWPFDMDDLRTAVLNLVSPPSASASGIFPTSKYRTHK